MHGSRVPGVNWQLRLRRSNAGDMVVVTVINEGCDGGCTYSTAGRNFIILSQVLLHEERNTYHMKLCQLWQAGEAY